MPTVTIITRIKQGDRNAFDELCELYYSSLISYARLMLRNDWADDVVQDVLYNVWQGRERLDDSTSLYKYMLRSVYNQSINYIKKNRYAIQYSSYYRERIEGMSHVYFDPDHSPVINSLYTQDLRAKLDEAIQSLPPKCRRVFQLSYIDDMSNKEISESLGIALSTVENHIHLALKQLRSTLSDSRLLLLLFFLIS